MPDSLATALAFDGLWLVALGAFLGGLVRGFAGFGTALVALPLMGQVLPPVWALVVLVVMDMVGPLPNLPRALRDGAMGQVGLLAAGAILGLAPGVWLLTRMEPDAFRLAVSVLALGMLVLLVSGLRWRGAMTRPLLMGTGGLSGFLGGVSGLAGPPVILLYVAGPNPPALIRANTLVYLFVFDILLLGLLGAQGHLSAVPVWLGLAMALPNLAGNIVGARLFNPGRERLYRAAAYAIITASALSGLPIWD